MAHKYLVSLRLYRVACYADVLINFGEGLNAIIGETDAGKTTIFRSLDWLLFNHTVGDIITYGETHGFAEGTFNDGTVITRGKKKTTHYYLLTRPDGTKEKFTGFGTRIPPDILEAHGMMPITIDEKTSLNLNFASQLDPAFGLSFSPGFKAKVVGHLQGAHFIDGAIQEASTRRMRASQRLTEVQMYAQEFQSKLEYLPDITVINERLVVLSGLLHDLRVEDTVIKRISNTVDTLMRTYRNEEKVIGVMIMEPALQNVDKLLAEVLAAVNNHESIRSIAELLDANSTETWKWAQYMDQATNAAELQEALITVIQDLEQYSELFRIRSSLEDVLTRITALEHLIRLSKDVSSTQERLGGLEEDLRSYQEVAGWVEKYTSISGRVDKGVKYIKDMEVKEQSLHNQITETLKLLKVCPVCGTEMGEIQHA